MFRLLPFYLLIVLVFPYGCTDHKLRPISQIQSRLKTTVGIDDKVETLYTYDRKNRLSSLTNRSGFFNNVVSNRTDIYYDEQGQYQLTERTNYSYPTGLEEIASKVYFTYQIDKQGMKTVTAKSYVVDPRSKVELLSITRNFKYDLNNHIISSSYLTSNSSSGTASFYYKDDNIIRVDSFTPQLTVYTYEYDSNFNPFYGLLQPDFNTNGRDAIVTGFSKNNITKGYTNNILTYTNLYQYNSQGLPVRIDLPYNNSRFSLTYELL